MISLKAFPQKEKSTKDTSLMTKILLYLLVLFHHLGIIGFLVSVPLLVMNEPFWVWLPVNTWILHLIFSPVLVCPLTIWENKLRKKLGWEKIDTFFKHYYIRPYKQWRKK